VQRGDMVTRDADGRWIRDAEEDGEAISCATPTLAPFRSRHAASVVAGTMCVYPLADLHSLRRSPQPLKREGAKCLDPSWQPGLVSACPPHCPSNTSPAVAAGHEAYTCCLLPPRTAPFLSRPFVMTSWQAIRRRKGQDSTAVAQSPREKMNVAATIVEASQSTLKPEQYVMRWSSLDTTIVRIMQSLGSSQLRPLA
jgi:hypothetical protein